MIKEVTLKGVDYFRPATEFHQDLRCTFTVGLPSNSTEEGFKKFFNDNGFTIGFNLFDTKDDYKKQVETVYKKLILIFDFNPDDENIVFVVGKINLTFGDEESITLPEHSIFVYDKEKIDVDYTEQA